MLTSPNGGDEVEGAGHLSQGDVVLGPLEGHLSLGSSLARPGVLEADYLSRMTP